MEGTREEKRRGEIMAEEESKTDGKSKKRKGGGKKDPFIYGNYTSYYGYRVGHDQEEDPRLAIFKKEWFEGKDCLDIGCNQGLITISIAKKFLCQSILGIDIDAVLIDTAYWNMRRLARMGNARRTGEKTSNSEGSSSADCLDRVVSGVPNEDLCNSTGDAITSSEENFLDRVSFRRENFIENLHGCSETYDTILCLSVTKWIHLNWGDAGLIKLFVKIWSLLRPGGIFVLEPQPWSSYKRNRLVSETTKMNFNSISIVPDCFREILLDKIGFRTVEIVTDSLSGTVAGFNRPIMVFVK